MGNGTGNFQEDSKTSLQGAQCDLVHKLGLRCMKYYNSESEYYLYTCTYIYTERQVWIRLFRTPVAVVSQAFREFFA